MDTNSNSQVEMKITKCALFRSGRRDSIDPMFTTRAHIIYIHGGFKQPNEFWRFLGDNNSSIICSPDDSYVQYYIGSGVLYMKKESGCWPYKSLDIVLTDGLSTCPP